MNLILLFILIVMAPMAVVAWKEARQARQALADPRLDSALREEVERAAIGAEFTLTMMGIFAFLFLMSGWGSA